MIDAEEALMQTYCARDPLTEQQLKAIECDIKAAAAKWKTFIEIPGGITPYTKEILKLLGYRVRKHHNGFKVAW